MPTNLTPTITVEQLKAAITSHPANNQMDTFCHVNPALARQLGLAHLQAIDLANPPPGVQLCIGGWILALAGYRACGVTIIECNYDVAYSLCHGGHVHTALQLLDTTGRNPDPEKLSSLFFPSEWPQRYDYTYTTLEPNDHAALTKLIYQVIDHYLPALENNHVTQ